MTRFLNAEIKRSLTPEDLDGMLFGLLREGYNTREKVLKHVRESIRDCIDASSLSLEKIANGYHVPLDDIMNQLEGVGPLTHKTAVTLSSAMGIAIDQWFPYSPKNSGEEHSELYERLFGNKPYGVMEMPMVEITLQENFLR